MPKFCDSCGEPLGEAKRFCPACGAPILGREAGPPAENPDKSKREQRRACARCGASLENDAAYCEQCGARIPSAADVPTAAAKAAAEEISRRYSPLWLIPLLLTALALFAVPASLQASGVPDILKNPLAWAVLLAASAAISLTLYRLLKRSKRALRKGCPSTGERDTFPPGAAASVSTGAGVAAVKTFSGTAGASSFLHAADASSSVSAASAVKTRTRGFLMGIPPFLSI